jgi:hypothetical protein
VIAPVGAVYYFSSRREIGQALAAGGHPGAEPDPSPPGDLSPVAPP